MPKTISVPQEGGDKLFRTPQEIAGNALLNKSLDALDTLQVDVLHSATNGEGGAAGATFDANVDLVGLGVAVGDLLTIDADGVEGFFVIGSISNGLLTDSLITFDTATQLRTGAAAAVAGGILTDGSVSPPFSSSPAVVVGDKVLFTTPASAAFSSINVNQVFNVTSVGATTLGLDGAPGDEASGVDYVVYRPPTLSFLPVSLQSVSSLTFSISKGSSSPTLQAPEGMRLVGFGDVSLSKVVNRAVQALANNTEYLRSLLESRLAIGRRGSITTSAALLDVTTSSIAGGIWTGALNKGAFTQAEIDEFARVIDNNGLDVEVGGVKALVTDIEDGLGTSILGKGFVTSAQATTVRFVLNVTVPGTVPNPIFVIFGQGKSWATMVESEPDALLRSATAIIGINDEDIPELVVARISTRFGSHADLLTRLQDIESRHQDWFWNGGAPSIQLVEDTTAGGGFALHIGATQIGFNNVSFELTPDAVVALTSSGVGFLKATLSGGGSPPGTLVVATIESENFDRTTLASADGDAGATEFIIGTYDTSDQSVRLLHVAEDAPQRRANELLGDGVVEGVTDDYETREAPAPDATARVFSGLALIGGHEVKNNVGAPGFTLTPTNFAAPNSRLDLVTLSKTGKLDLVTGVESGTPVIPDLPADTIELSKLFLRRTAGGAGPPLTLNDTNNGTDSFVHLNPQRFLVQTDGTGVNHHPANHVRNGAFLTDPTVEWVPNSGTIGQTAAQVKFGDNAGDFTPAAGAGAKFTEHTISDIKPFLGRYATLSFYVRLATVNSATARLSLIVTGGTDLVATATANNELWQRVHISGFIPSDVTALVARLEGDTTAANTTQVYFDGVQFSVGKELTEFEYPPRLIVAPGGSTVPFESTPDSIINGGLVTDAVAANTVDITAGSAIIGGKQVSWTALSLSGFGASTTNFISVDDIGTVSTATAKPIGDVMFLAVVVTNGGDISTVDDLRLFLAEGESSVTGCSLIHVGTDAITIGLGKFLVNGEIRVNPSVFQINLSNVNHVESGVSNIQNTWYYIYGADSANDGTFVNKPSGDFFYSDVVPTDRGRHPVFGWKYIGAVFNESNSGSALRSFAQRGSRFYFTQAALFSGLSGTQTVQLDGRVPRSAKMGIFVYTTVFSADSGSNTTISFIDIDTGLSVGFTSAIITLPVAISNRGHTSQQEAPISKGNHEMRVSINNAGNVTFTVYIRGYIDNLIATEAI